MVSSTVKPILVSPTLRKLMSLAPPGFDDHALQRTDFHGDGVEEMRRLDRETARL